MANSIKTDQVVYVEPNIVEDFTSYSSGNMGDVYKSVSIEDMSIVVGLQVEVRGRTYQTSLSGNDSNIQRMMWQSSSNRDKVSFMQGSKIKTQNMGEIYSLTTSYTNTHLYDIQNDGTSEMFGIKSIDVSYNNFMVPEVTIQFVDVRGVSMFAQEEMRHNLSDGYMNGLINNDIEGSFFKSFFTFPYPKFTLFVKGFYGQMVSYELTCSDFRAAFDSNTGNFNVTAKFVGYAFSFLNDIMVNGLIGAPYSEYIGEKYWEDNVRDRENARFYVENRNGTKVPMQKLGYICKLYREIQQRVALELEEKGYAVKAGELGYSEDEQKILNDSDLTPLRMAYQSLMDSLEEVGDAIKVESSKKGDAYIKAVGTNSRCFITNSNKDELERLIGVFENFNKNELSEYARRFPDIAAWKRGHSFALLKYDDYNDILQDSDTYDIKTSVIKPDEEKALKDAIERLSKDTCINYNNGKKTYKQAWQDYDSTVYIYKDFGLSQLLSEKVNIQANEQESVDEFKKKIEQQILNEKFNEVFGFEPTVENITRIVMAHVETFIQMISQCSQAIASQGSKRSVREMGISLDNFPDIGGNTQSGADLDTLVQPFSKVVRFKEEGGVKRQEDEWIGNIYGLTPENTEEIKLVEGLLNGISDAASDLSKANVSYINTNTSQYKTPILYPLSYNDLFLDEGDSVFGKNFKVSDINEVFARFCVRAFSVLAAHKPTNIQASVYGMADAENFLDEYENDKGISVIAEQIDSVTVQKVMDFFTHNDTKTYGIDKSKNSNPWYIVSTIIEEVSTDVYKLYVGDYGEMNNIFPVKNWDFREISYIADYKNGLKSRNLFNRYITTFCPESENDTKYTPIIIAKDSPVQYFKNCISPLSNSKYNNDNNFVNKVFSTANGFEFEGWGDVYNYTATNGVAFYDSDGEKCNIGDAVQYDMNGDVKESSCALSLNNFFFKSSFRDLPLLQRAECFIKEVFHISPGLKSIASTEEEFRYLPKFAILRDAVYVRENKDRLNIRPTIINFYINYFNEWALNNIDGYLKIESDFSLSFKEGASVDYDKFLDDVWSSVQSANNNSSLVLDKIHSYLSDEGCRKFDSEYVVVPQSSRYIYSLGTSGEDIGGVLLVNKSCKEMNSLLKDLTRVVALCKTTKFNMTDRLYHVGASQYPVTPYLERRQIEGYISGVIDVLKERIGKVGNPEIPVEVKINNDPDDIKVGVYNYIKLLYDKWLASGEESDFYKMETLFNGSNPTFHFIDSVYTKIGKVMYLNLSTLVDRVYQSQVENGYTLLSMMSNLYADNKFMFLCIQNFMDLANEDMMDKMFRPVSYLDCEEPSNHPNFIVLMPYEPSSKLDVQGADYPDDTFYLNDINNLPEMIKSKAPGNPIPAFGVCYGQQYQNYFKDIQVDMNAPMVTEQSIKAKFMIAGVGDGENNNGPRMVTAGQDLYTIYSNNSYTCTVTMMGCAWVQPMMYFVLQNVPMFRGSYMIVKVNHQIQPGNMITTFKGVRMAKTGTRAVELPIFANINSSIGRATDTTGEDISTGSYSAIGNDCNYAYFDPLQRTVTQFSDDDAKAYCYAAYQKLMRPVDKGGAGLTSEQAKGVCANLRQESRFNPFVIRIDGSDKEGDKHHGVGGGLGGFYFYKGHWVDSGQASRAQEVYMFAYGPVDGKRKLVSLNTELDEKYWKGSLSTVNNAKIRTDGYKFDVPFEKQIAYLCSVINNAPVNEIKNTTNPVDAAESFRKTFENGDVVDRWNNNGNGKWVESAIESQLKVKSNGNGIEIGDEIDELAVGLRNAVEMSLRTSQYSVNAEVVMTKSGGGYYMFNAKGNSYTNTLFDCFLNQYDNWFDDISWDVGNTKISNNARYVKVHVVKSVPPSHTITVTGTDTNNNGQTFVIQSRSDINESLRLILIKYFKSKNITTPSAAKTVFRACSQMGDDTVSELFEFSEDNKSVRECDSVMGKYNQSRPSGAVDDFSGEVTNDLMKKVLSDVNHINSKTKGNNFEIRKNIYYGCCTSGPSTWYNRAKDNMAKDDMMNADLWWGKGHVDGSTFETTKPYLNGKCGFECIWHGTKEDAIAYTPAILRPGDICTLHAHSNHGNTSHGAMWTGKDWRSDAIQNGIWIYGSYGGRCDDYSVCIWRHPDFQEPGKEVIPVA